MHSTKIQCVNALLHFRNSSRTQTPEDVEQREHIAAQFGVDRTRADRWYQQLPSQHAYICERNPRFHRQSEANKPKPEKQQQDKLLRFVRRNQGNYVSENINFVSDVLTYYRAEYSDTSASD